MNAITYKAAYSLFPKATFEEKVNLVTAIRDTKYEDAVQKYADRGWRPTKEISSEMQKNAKSSFRYEKRWVIDGKTWILPLDLGQFGITERYHTVDPFETCSYNLCPNMDDLRPEMRFVIFRNPVLPRCFIVNLELAEKVKILVKAINVLKSRGFEIDPEGWVFCIRSFFFSS